MKYYECENKLIVTEFDSFDIEEILECGQCFRFESIGFKEYIIIAFGKVLHIKQTDKTIEFYPCTGEDFENIWIPYFEFDRDYNEIKNILSEKDNVMKQAVSFAPGIRILKQEPWECLISFIISQNNRIPMIKQVIKNISQKYGTKENDYFLFPSIKQLEGISEEELMLCKTGFRAKYIIDAVRNVLEKNIDFKKLENVSTEDVRKKLMEIKGVGQKVSDCVMLFSMNRKEVFPTDVWIKRVMEDIYFDGKETKISDIHDLAKEKFGQYAGFAQQYLFHYARQMKINSSAINR